MDTAEKVVSAIERAWGTTFEARGPEFNNIKFAAETLQIAASLDGLFRDDKVVRDWLREPQDSLGGDTPLDHIHQNGVGGAQCVREFVDYICGR